MDGLAPIRTQENTVGQAKLRGTFEQRQAEGIAKRQDEEQAAHVAQHCTSSFLASWNIEHHYVSSASGTRIQSPVMHALPD